jgi:membrane protein
MDTSRVAALRSRARRVRAELRSTAQRIPIVGRLLREFVRIEFIDRCMLIAAQGLLALVPMLVVLAAFFPHVTDNALGELTDVTGLGAAGSREMSSDLDTEQVRAQTGLVGLAITVFSATSFARALLRMYERVWERPHIGGLVGTRRCFVWLVGWLLVLQIIGALHTVLSGDTLAGDMARGGARMVAMTGIWWATSWLLLFGRVGWLRLLPGAALTGVVSVLYVQVSRVWMPPYVAANARQFGTLGIILSLSTWLIGLGAVLVGSALVGRVVIEDPTVLRVLRALRRRLGRPGAPAARGGAGEEPRRPAGRS